MIANRRALSSVITSHCLTITQRESSRRRRRRRTKGRRSVSIVVCGSSFFNGTIVFVSFVRVRWGSVPFRLDRFSFKRLLYVTNFVVYTARTKRRRRRSVRVRFITLRYGDHAVLQSFSGVRALPDYAKCSTSGCPSRNRTNRLQ